MKGIKGLYIIVDKKKYLLADGRESVIIPRSGNRFLYYCGDKEIEERGLINLIELVLLEKVRFLRYIMDTIRKSEWCEADKKYYIEKHREKDRELRYIIQLVKRGLAGIKLFDPPAPPDVERL